MKKNNRDAQKFFEMALAELGAGNLKLALTSARKLTKLAPKVGDAWSLRGIISQQSGELNDAVKFFSKAVKLSPKDGGLRNNQGNALRAIGRLDEAIKTYRRSLELRPNHFDTLMNLGNTLSEQRRYPEAESVFREVISLAPQEKAGYLNLGTVLCATHRYQEGLEIFQMLLVNGQDSVDVRNNIYNCLVSLGRFDAAESELSMIKEMAPDDPNITVNASILYFLMGRWQDGWEAYAARWQWKPEEIRPFPQPWWNGEPLDGRKLLIWFEQGLGDQILYACMIPDLVEKGAILTCECDERLVPIFKRSFPKLMVYPQLIPAISDPDIVNCELQCPITNFGKEFRANESHFRGGQAYLVADQERTSKLRAKYLAGSNDLLVGLSWRSFNPDTGDLKSIPLQSLKLLFNVAGIQFVNLQYGKTQVEEIECSRKYGFEMIKDPEIDPMTDVDGHAAQVAAMDLIISVSNTTVHVAGALGIPAWCFLQKIPSTRWLMNREDSPWYSSVRLFRQHTAQNWTEPIAAVADALSEFAIFRS